MDEFDDIQRGGRTARVRRDEGEAIAAALLGESECEAVALGGRGELYRFGLNAGPGLIRPFRRGGAMRFLMRNGYLFANRPLLELETLRTLYGRGLPVPEPLGAVWRRSGAVIRGSIATREIEGENLLSYLSGEDPERENVLRDCGRTIRVLHDAGVDHADLQVENLFVGRDGIRVLDFDKARVLPDLGRRNRLRNLVRLARSMRKRGLARAHFDTLCEGYALEPDAQRALVAVLAHRFPDYTRGEDTGAGHWKIESAEGYTPAEMVRVVETGGELLKPPATWETRRVGEYVVKESRVRSLADISRAVRDPQRFRRSWEVSAALRAKGVAVPEACAYLERRRFGLVLRSATVTRYIADSINVEQAARKLEASGEIAHFLERLADAVNHLEAAGAWHADLSGKNILTTAGSDAPFFFIDLDSVRLDTPVTPERRLKNHVQLYDSFCDVWDETVLRPCILRMLPESDSDWLARVQAGQRERRARQERRWAKQGRGAAG